MRLSRPLGGGLACLTLLLAAAAARADAPPDPLRFVPDKADFFVEVKQPRKLIEAGLSLDLARTLYDLPPVRKYYDSTNARWFFQLLAYFEKDLGAQWPELLDRLAGGGAVLSGKFGGDNTPALFVVQGTDEALMRKFFKSGLLVLEQEL